MEETYKVLDLEEHFTKSKESLFNLKFKIKDLKLLKTGNHSFIHDHFLKLRNEIVLDKERSKVLIDNHFSELINLLDKIEADYKVNSINLKGDYDLKSFETNFVRLNVDLENQYSQLDTWTIEFNTDNWDKILIDSDKQITKLEALKKSLQSELISDQAYMFTPIFHSLRNEIKSAKIHAKIVNSLFLKVIIP